jgi:hypothetical protein
MYHYVHPAPIVVPLTDDEGWELRQTAAEFMATNLNRTGAERGSTSEQGFGVLAEMVVRKRLGMPLHAPADQSLTYDILLPNGVKVDVKCRGGALPFREAYQSGDGLPREAKHNLFARQVYDPALDTDLYLMTHLETPKDRQLPGTRRQRKWVLYICGWVSKKRVVREGVYLPRGSLTEQGNTWFTYRGQEVEFYHRNLNGLQQVADLLQLEQTDVIADQERVGEPNLTSVDTVRIAYDLAGRGLLQPAQLAYVLQEAGFDTTVKPILHPNQYLHLLQWLQENGQATDRDMAAVGAALPEQPFSGI